MKKNFIFINIVVLIAFGQSVLATGGIEQVENTQFISQGSNLNPLDSGIVADEKAFMISLLDCRLMIFSYIGKYSNAEMEIIIVEKDGSYSGEIKNNQQSFLFKVERQGNNLVGQFEDKGKYFDFEMFFYDSSLLLKTGQSSYILTKELDNPID